MDQFWVHWCYSLCERYNKINTALLFEIILLTDDTTLVYSNPDISSKLNT